MEFVWVEGGCYEMGCGSWTDSCYSDEKPVHTVCVDGFWMGKYEVTVGQYLKCVDEGACPVPEWLEKGNKYNIHTGSKKYYYGKLGRALTSKNYPIVGVSWNDARAFAKWLFRKTGRTFRLPTEAEWEYACRSGGKKVKYATSTGRLSHDLANYDGTGGRDRWEYTSPVGSFPANPLGLYDMSGNVWEWCEDWYDKNYYSRSPRNNPQGPSSGKYRVLRGGSWYNGPRGLRCAIRNWNGPVLRNYNFGFRLVRLRSAQ
ncbi:formylglycine-generating enzyme family protein [Desulfothermus naphthae]